MLHLPDIQIFAHRGSKGTHPENTMAAFREAQRVGANGIEFDVHLSADGELVIIHDEKLDRTTTLSGYVKDFTRTDLKRADAGRKFSESFSGEKIPFLGEVFEWAQAHSMKMNIEIKTDHIPYPGIEEKIIASIRRYRYEDRVILSSFNHQSIERVKELAPEVERALLFEGIPAKLHEILTEKKEAGFHPDARHLTKPILEFARQLGYKIRPWVANQEEQIRELADMKVDVIMTDFPEKALKLLRRM